MRLLKNLAAQCSIVCSIAGFAVGFGLCALIYQTAHKEVFDQRELEHTYKYISPLLACADPSVTTLPNDQAEQLQNKLASTLALMKAQGQITEGAVYFRELNNGPWVGVNYNDEFTPGSLLKVPLAISIYDIAEDDPSVLTKKIAYDPGTNPLNQHFPGNSIPKGDYSPEELVAQMLENSDNAATIALAGSITETQLDDSYSHLGIKPPTQGNDYVTSVRNYASFFRVLYNGTYLSHEHSEKVLSMLAQSNFKQALVAGLPQGIPIAHKFGERSLDPEHKVQLHDCGIIYKPKQPYLLCVMMRGTDFDTLARSIASISKSVYEYVE